MNTHANLMLNDPNLNSEIKNKGFAILDELFKKWMAFTKTK